MTSSRPRLSAIAPAAAGTLLLLACGSGNGMASRSAATVHEAREPGAPAAAAPSGDHAGHHAETPAGAETPPAPGTPSASAGHGAPAAGLAPDTLDRPAPVAEAEAARASQAVKAMAGHAHGGEYRHLDAGRESSHAPAAASAAEPAHVHPPEPPPEPPPEHPEGHDEEPGRGLVPEQRRPR